MANRKVHPNSLANLQKFPKGQSGNPAGHAKGVPNTKNRILTQFSEALEQELAKGETFRERYIREFMNRALSANTYESKFLAERLFSENIIDEIDSSLNKLKREDDDFLRYRLYERAHDIQQQILLSKQPVIICLAGRRAGKTEANILKAVKQMIEDNSHVVIVGLSFSTCIDQYFKKVVENIEMLGLEITESRRNEGYLAISNGSDIHFHGSTTIPEIDKLRGYSWQLAIIDECQSQRNLGYLVEDVISPALRDTQGQLMLSGTGPKIRGTRWEQYWTDNTPALRLNWNMTHNPFIKDHEEALAMIRKEKGLTEESGLYRREYLAQICYDTDALVYRLTDENLFDDSTARKWIESQPRSDIRFVGGLDVGFVDSDAFVILMYSERKKERFLVYEYKASREGISQLVDAIKTGLKYIQEDPLFADIPDKFFYIYTDTGGGGKKIAYELNTQYGLPCADAYKADKNTAVEMLQQEVRTGATKVREVSPFREESMKTIFRRDPATDYLTREVDDDTFHPDMMDALLYAHRPIWMYTLGGTDAN